MRSFWMSKKSWKGVFALILHRTKPLSCPKQPPHPHQMKNRDKATEKQNILFQKFLSKKDVFPFSLSRTGSITVETACVLPLFLCFCVQVISFISLLQLHSSLEAALHQEAAEAAVWAYVYEKAGEGEYQRGLHLLEEATLKNKVIDRAGKKYLDSSMIEGGSKGICLVCHMPKSEEQDTVDITLSYRVKPVIDILGFSGFSMGNRCRMKAWTGYKIIYGESGEGREEYVYITETGSVYHKRRDCTYLDLSIKSVSSECLTGMRNREGAKYYHCENCNEVVAGTVWVTDYGNRYHTSISCSGLKRTVMTVPVSEAGGRGPCSKCGGMD